MSCSIKQLFLSSVILVFGFEIHDCNDNQRIVNNKQRIVNELSTTLHNFKHSCRFICSLCVLYRVIMCHVFVSICRVLCSCHLVSSGVVCSCHLIHDLVTFILHYVPFIVSVIVSILVSMILHLCSVNMFHLMCHNCCNI